jgi:hypothetical protein
VSVAAALALAGIALYPCVHRMLAVRAVERRIAAVESVVSASPGDARWTLTDPAISLRVEHLGPLLASWETIGGCGAASSNGTGAGVKWIGRNATGGLFHVEIQNVYSQFTWGYSYTASALVTRDLGVKWTVGIAVPYLYKFMNDPFGVGTNLQNAGLGDVSALVMRRFGTIDDWMAVLSVGAPTGTHDVLFRGLVLLPQDRQLGFGRFTASAFVDHTIDKTWGPVVLGGIVNWRGGENEFHSYRAPSASVYGYAGYLAGPFVPALGLVLTGLPNHDRDQGSEMPTALVSLAPSASIEWSADWVAFLLAASIPYQYVGDVAGVPHGFGLGPWLVSAGIALAPF